MKHSKLKEVLLIKDKVYLYITPKDIYLRIDKIERRSGIKVYRIINLPRIQLLRNFFKKIKAYIYLLDVEDVYENKKNAKLNNKNKYSNNRSKDRYYKNNKNNKDN